MLIQSYISGNLVASSNKQTIDVFNPANDQVIAQVSIAGEQEVELAARAAQQAYTSWSQVTPLRRARILHEFKNLLLANKERLVAIVTQEHGKTLADAEGELTRGLEVVEFAIGIPHLLKGEYSANVGTNVDCYSIRQPIGVCLGITPFNFPLMVPMWMFPIAIACGNTFILKPSEQDPSVCNEIALLLQAAGLPDGVFNVVHGDKTTVELLLQQPEITAVSFVGSTPVAKLIQEYASKFNKRVQALGGAKNHCVVMPDADLGQAVKGVLAAGFGSAGQRCMAISVVVTVGPELHANFIAQLTPQVEQIIVGPGDHPKAEMGPVISKAQLNKLHSYIESGLKQGATLSVDGRLVKHSGQQQGYYLGPCLFTDVTPAMQIYQEEMFGPILVVVNVSSLQAAIELINQQKFANGTGIFTSSGAVAREFADKIQVGMVGINVAIPVPMAFHSFGGWKQSFFAEHAMHGTEGINFYTQLKTVTTRWPQDLAVTKQDLSMPVLS